MTKDLIIMKNQTDMAFLSQLSLYFKTQRMKEAVKYYYKIIVWLVLKIKKMLI